MASNVSTIEQPDVDVVTTSQSDVVGWNGRRKPHKENWVCCLHIYYVKLYMGYCSKSSVSKYTQSNTCK